MESLTDLTWNVDFTTRCKKEIADLSEEIQTLVFTLLRDLEDDGPMQPEWPNYSKLRKRKKLIPSDAYHCHLKKGRPTYVACWKVINKKSQEIEVYYVGTHENAPY